MVIMMILLFLALVFGGSWYAYRIAFFSPDDKREHIPCFSGNQYAPYQTRIQELYRILSERPFESVAVESSDGLILSGRYYHQRDGAPLDICFHGYRSHPLTDFSGGSMLSLSMGHNLLLVDQRSHHKSQGKSICFGILERWDVLSWVDYALNRFGEDTQVTLYGISMGGATVLMAAGLPLPDCVKGIVADCPYAVAEDIILEVGKKLRYPAWLIRPFLHSGAFLFGDFRLGETTAMEAVRDTTVPILIIHGEADGLVPCAMSEPVQKANPKMVQRVTFPGADHGISFLTDEERYGRVIREFAGKILS